MGGISYKVSAAILQVYVILIPEESSAARKRERQRVVTLQDSDYMLE